MILRDRQNDLMERAARRAVGRSTVVLAVTTTTGTTTTSARTGTD